MTRASWVATGLVLSLGLACGEEPSPTAAGEVAGPPASHARALLDEARRELADPERAPLRQGMEIDEEALRQALLRLRAQHGPQVAAAYRASIDALPEGQPPAPERFTEVATFELPGDPATRDAEAINWVFDEDVRATVGRVLGTYVTLMMRLDLGMTTADLGVWMSFLRVAEPTLRRCGGTASSAFALCVDYGDDVFVLDVERQEPAWVVTRLRWMQARQD